MPYSSYLRSTTGYSRLNHLMMLHVHKDRADAITLVDVANDFVGKKENRKQLFGKFLRERYPKQVLYFVKATQRKIRDKTIRIVYNCSDLTCTKKYALTEGPKSGRGTNVGYSLIPPPQSFSARYGPVKRIIRGGRRRQQ